MKSSRLTKAFTGAGPSGLVTAKTLLHHYPKGRFAPVIFDLCTKVGGLWNVTESSGESTNDVHGFIDPSMRTNLSRFTVSFSDYAWESVPSRDDVVGLFPQACQVQRYLEGYTERYVPKDRLRLGCRVARTQRNSSGDGKRWIVEWEEVTTYVDFLAAKSHH
jgi:cation diffusion facilitator CzcD-associated flavoprotein CzcO